MRTSKHQSCSNMSHDTPKVTSFSFTSVQLISTCTSKDSRRVFIVSNVPLASRLLLLCKPHHDNKGAALTTLRPASHFVSSWSVCAFFFLCVPYMVESVTPSCTLVFSTRTRSKHLFFSCLFPYPPTPPVLSREGCEDDRR